MKYGRFEELPVWKTAIEPAVRVYELTKDRFFNQPGDLRDQLRRAGWIRNSVERSPTTFPYEKNDVGATQGFAADSGQVKLLISEC